MGFPIPSPAILDRIGLGFRKAVAEFARDNDIPVIRFVKGAAQVEVMGPHLDRLAREGRTGVAAIGARGAPAVLPGTTYHPEEGGGACPAIRLRKCPRIAAFLLVRCYSWDGNQVW